MRFFYVNKLTTHHSYARGLPNAPCEFITMRHFIAICNADICHILAFKMTVDGFFDK